jgi:phage head maturation protease
MSHTIGPMVGPVHVLQTPADVVRSLIGIAAIRGTETELVQRMAGAVGGGVDDIHALVRGDLLQVRHMCDDTIVGRMAGAAGVHPLTLAYRSAMYADTTARAAGVDMDEDGKPDEAVDEDPKGVSYPFVMSDASPDRADDIVSQGWDLSEFAANPVGPYNHDYSALPVGKWARVRVQSGVLRGTFIATPSDSYPMSLAVADMLKAGSLRTCSVGFRPRAVIARSSLPEDDPMYSERGYVYVSPRLLECSITPMPMNPRAARRSVEQCEPEPVARAWQPLLKTQKRWAPFLQS